MRQLHLLASRAELATRFHLANETLSDAWKKLFLRGTGSLHLERR